MSKTGAVSLQTARFVRDHCLCLHAQRAARSLARRFDQALRPVGLTSGQFSLLVALSPPKPSAIKAVAAVLAMDRTTLTANLKPLERRGLVMVAVDPADKRGRLLGLTRAGRKRLRTAVAVWRRTQAEVEHRLEKPDADALRAALRTLS